ncbi:hypothetical protein [Phormidium sp. FACHB-1136]|jgi:hypothetical protein|uniref:DUF7219 family protein n=1 Tax=Phormidium sp. FACHB-1136 TaxID=2692848 RepID=UPI00168708E2|nr:hypothetical protein [Phormidium sp. FACHB-1136]MBD2427573.1 hypothetical protein [Phormidium sp. FACHB-1136]
MTRSNPSSDAQAHDQMLFPRSRYYGEFSPKNLAFNANLQEFAHRVGYISCLNTGGKISPEDAYQRIQGLYHQLKQSKKSLGL